MTYINDCVNAKMEMEVGQKSTLVSVLVTVSHNCNGLCLCVGVNSSNVLGCYMHGLGHTLRTILSNFYFIFGHLYHIIMLCGSKS